MRAGPIVTYVAFAIIIVLIEEPQIAKPNTKLQMYRPQQRLSLCVTQVTCVLIIAFAVAANFTRLLEYRTEVRPYVQYWNVLSRSYQYIQGVPQLTIHFVLVVFSASRARTEEYFTIFQQPKETTIPKLTLLSSLCQKLIK